MDGALSSLAIMCSLFTLKSHVQNRDLHPAYVFNFQLFSKKTPPDNITDWLENAFPGKFKVLDSNLKMLDVMAQFKGEKEALVADKADTEVQFLLDWTKGIPNLGLDTASIQAQYEKSREETERARQLFKDLKAKGLQQFSVGVIEQAAYIEVFQEPVPEVRAKVLQCLTDLLGSQAQPPQTSIFVEFLEPESYHTEVQDIIPRGHWTVDAGYIRENKIMALDFEYKKGLDFTKVNPFWELNPESKRALEFQDLCFKTAQTWAFKNISQSCFMTDEQPTGFESVEAKSPRMRYLFPYFNQKPVITPENETPEPTGYVTGEYDFDQKIFTAIKKQKQF